jgi:hypothetical protein
MAEIETAAAASCPPVVRLVFFNGASEYELTKLHAECVVDHQEDAKNSAFDWSAKKWLAVALEVDGKLERFANNEHVVMKVSTNCTVMQAQDCALDHGFCTALRRGHVQSRVYTPKPLTLAPPSTANLQALPCLQILDERDEEEGVRLLKEQVSSRPWPKDGMHYFAAVEWRKVGAYRVMFVMRTMRKAFRDAGVDVPPLAVSVAVEDPEYQRRLKRSVGKRLPLLLAQYQRELQRHQHYPQAPLNKRERCVRAC